MSRSNRLTLSRRALMQASVSAGIASALAPLSFSYAQDASSLPLITKAIPSTGEKLPVVGLGTNAYSVTAPEELAARREVLEHFPKLGAKVVDTAYGYGEAEVVIGRLLKELGNRDQIFLATKTPIRDPITDAKAAIDQSFKRLNVSKIDLLQIHNLNGLDVLYPALVEAKEAGRIRYVGISTSTDDQYEALAAALKKYRFDFVQVDYSIENRGSEEVILPLAQERGLAVLINVPLGGRRGNVLSKVAGKPLPDWAKDIDVTSWAQLLLKYNVSHPAVTAVIPGTTKLTHLRDNQLAARGRLPDAATRKKIEALWATV
jgi:aryl-alcohol dehydrogenase-like predicted oxidoreductase